MTFPAGACLKDMNSVLGTDQAVLVLDGEWDLARQLELHETLDDWAATLTDDETAVLDLRRTDFIDSTVMHEFLKLEAGLTDRGIRLRTLCRPRSIVLRALCITSLEAQLGVVEAG